MLLSSQPNWRNVPTQQQVIYRYAINPGDRVTGTMEVTFKG